MPDAYESLYGLDIGKDDRDDDPDRDMLSNIKEYFLGTSPVIGDSDGDGLTDGWELAYGYNPQVPDDTSADEDADGLDLVLEQLAGTNPRSFDTDEDLLGDGEEVRLGCSPLAADTDDDGLTDFIENKIGTDPSNADTDGDGMPDGWEVENGLDPLSSADATLDGDADGLTNCQEYFSGTSPSAGDTDEDGVFDADDDSDGDQVSNWRELNEFKTNPLLKDSDRDGVDDLEEINAGRDPLTGSDSATWLTQKYSRWEASYGFRYNGAFAGFSSHNARSLDLFGFDPNPNYIYESGAPFNRMEFGQFFYQYTNGTWSTDDPYLTNISDVMKGPIIYSIYWSVFSQAYSSLGSSFHQDGVPYAGEITRISASYWTRVKGVETLTKFVLDDESAREQYLQNPAGSQVTDWSAAGPSAYLRLGGYESSTYRVKCPADWNDPVHWVIVFTPEDGDAEKKYYFLSWNPHGGESPEFVLDPDQLNPGVYGNYEAIFYQASLCADLNRDGLIVPPILENSNNPLSDRTADNLLRFWINDDDDDGDEANQTALGGNSDEPGKLSGWFEFDGRTPDHAKTGVDGRCDLIDFFPVYLDIKQLLTVLPHTTAGVTYKLKQADDGLNFVYTDLSRGHAFDYLTKEDQVYGTSLNKLPHLAETVAIKAEGVALSTTFLDKIKNGTDKGIILVEGTKATDRPLRLVVEKDGSEIAEISLNIKISEVEKMYRWINLRSVAGQSEKRPTNTSEPENYPDNITNGKMFIWLHGYNVNEQQSRAWNAEAFKRLYQSRSRAMFTAVTWHGDHSQIPLIGVAPDYWENITHAFKTSAELPAAVSALPGSSKIIVGHSMGNVVVASAIKDHGLNVTQYFMLNAAVALEAFDTNAMSIDAMRHPNWSTYDPHLWATEWYQLFPGEGRAGLTWRNRFGDISNAINFYSSGEEVLNNNDAASGGTPGQVPPIGGERAWVLQEMVKGTQHIGAVLTFDSQGGWGFNGHWDKAVTTTTGGPHGGTTTTYRHLDSTEANLLTDAELKAQPFFRRFQNTAILGANGSTTASEYLVRADALGTAIPALSFPTGRNPIPLFDQQDRNVNLMDLKDGWPRSAGRWFHSDAKNVAYRYNHKLWEKWVDDGGLR